MPLLGCLFGTVEKFNIELDDHSVGQMVFAPFNGLVPVVVSTGTFAVNSFTEVDHHGIGFKVPMVEMPANASFIGAY